MCIFIPSVDLTPSAIPYFRLSLHLVSRYRPSHATTLYNIHSTRKWQTWFYYSMRLFYYSMRLFYYSMRLFYYSMTLFYYSMRLFYYSMRLFYYNIFHSPLSMFLRLLGPVASDLPTGDANISLINSLITRTRYYVRDDSLWIFTDCKRIVNVVCSQQKPHSGSTNPVHPLCRICPTCKK